MAVGKLDTHGYARDREDAAYKAFHAGFNMDMACYGYLNKLPRLVKVGRITEAQIDELVLPLLVAKFELGLFENAYIDESKMPAVFIHPASSKFAREAAQSSMVLLKNDGQLLPLDQQSLVSEAKWAPPKLLRSGSQFGPPTAQLEARQLLFPGSMWIIMDSTAGSGCCS